MSEETTTADAKKREPKKNSIPSVEVEALVKGIPQYTKASFLVVGHKSGVRLAIPLTSGVSRAYFYANGDYSVIPDHPAITVFDEALRKAKHKGGIMAEVEFADLDRAREALSLLVDAVRNAEAPPPKAVKQPKVPKKAKAAPVAITKGESEFAGSADGDDSDDAVATAEA